MVERELTVRPGGVAVRMRVTGEMKRESSPDWPGEAGLPISAAPECRAAEPQAPLGIGRGRTVDEGPLRPVEGVREQVHDSRFISPTGEPMSKAFRINPALDVRELRARFEKDKRLHIPDFLVTEDAERLLSFLKGSDGWKLVVNQGEKLFELDRAAQSELKGERERQLELAVYAAARNGFQFRFETIRVPDRDADRAADRTPLNQFARFLSSASVLEFLRTVTGFEDVRFADAQGTAYGPGHFLTAHDDDVAGKQRRAAYVLNLSRDWPVDWGGLLTFPNAPSATAQAFIPTFNALNLFSVPQLHSVSIVAPFAARRRYSVTGWLRSGHPE